ncbi:hypothetical protein LXA43DRAFT_972446 [Ganoderma leucocontextum]|nr:hypothetical protein LXA43DRAFT_972446 [Ganoderma leucocontextum]
MRRMPTFGHDQIHHFWHDVTSRKRLAARDYEVFLIHALIKLCLHMAVTLDIFCAATEHMYEAICHFAAETCPKYNMHELPSEAAACVQRSKAINTNMQLSGARWPVEFTVHHTYKFHSLADYADYIECSGTSDNFNT